MTIAMPKLAAAHASSLMVCGIAVSTNDEFAKVIDSHKKRWAYYNAASDDGVFYLRLGLDKSPKGFHLHVDVETEESFGGEKPPEPSKNVRSFDELLSVFAGERLRTIISASFTCPMSETPGIIKITQKISANKDGVTLKMTSGTFSVEGSPIGKIAWSVKPETVRIEMSSRMELTVSDNYLQEALDFISKYYSAFIAKGVPDGNR